MSSRRTTNSTLSDVLIGAAAGALAVWVMDRADWFNFKHENHHARRRTQSVRPGGMDPAHVGADKLARTLGTNFGDPKQNAAGVVTHYAIGVAPAAVYAVLRHKVPAVSMGHGTVWGTSLFLLQDEGFNAIVGLAGKPSEYPWEAHARGFVAHALYGLVLETTLRITDELRRGRRGGAFSRMSEEPRSR